MNTTVRLDLGRWQDTLAEVDRLREELQRANYDAAMFERDAACKGDRIADLEHARACLLGDVEEPPPGPAMTE